VFFVFQLAGALFLCRFVNIAVSVLQQIVSATIFVRNIEIGIAILFHLFLAIFDTNYCVTGAL